MSPFKPELLTEQQTRQAISCLYVIEEVDNLWLPSTIMPIGHQTGTDGQDGDLDEQFEDWARSFPVRESFFDDNVVEDLIKFLPSFDAVATKRVRRIRLWFREHPEYVQPTFT